MGKGGSLSAKRGFHVLQIRFHGRGGQGVVTAVEMVATAAFLDGKVAQAFPTFGSERTGAPVTAFCRISDREIRTREPITHPDVVIVQDSTLLHQVDVFGGLAPQGFVLINSTRSLEELSVADYCSTFPVGHCLTMPATDFGMKHLGRPIGNAALVAGFAALTHAVTQASVEEAMRRVFPGPVGERNAAVARDGFAYLAAHVAGV